jgi:hypothetical protein
MTQRSSRLDDAGVTLTFYGSIIYLAVISALGSLSAPPPPQVAISTLVATAMVLYIAHVFTALVPKTARAGHLHGIDFRAALVHDTPLLIAALVPIAPLALAAWEVIDIVAAYQFSVRLTIALLFALAISLSRREGLSWSRALIAGLVIIVIAIVVITLESLVH